MRNLLSLAALPMIAAGALLAPVPASAAIALPTTTLYFSGACIDCAGTGTAELVLSNYTLGQTVGQANFVSLHYDGSNLIGAFTISASESPNVTGEFDPPLPAAENFQLFGQQYYFETEASGSWMLGRGSVLLDFGTNGLYDTAPPATAVPEPLSLTLMLTGLAGTALFARRRNA